MFDVQICVTAVKISLVNVDGSHQTDIKNNKGRLAHETGDKFMSDQSKQPLTEEQQRIAAELKALATPVKAYKSFYEQFSEKESKGDINDLTYNLNMAHSHTSILHQQADYWKQRALSAEAELAKHGLTKSQKISQRLPS